MGKYRNKFLFVKLECDLGENNGESIERGEQEGLSKEIKGKEKPA
jgi:hypothetical protein